MNDRPTPETDAAYKYWPSENAELVDADFARNLERERDEAREALENHTASTIHSCHVNCKRPMCVLRRERDEAREEIRDWKRLHDAAERGVDLTIAEGTISDLLKQRDEARAELANLESLMFGGLVQSAPKNALAWRVFDSVMAIKKERDEARKEINGIRITLSKNGEAVGNGEIDFSIIEMIENLIQSKDYFVRKSDSLERERDEAREVIRNIVRAGRVGRKWQSYAIEFLEKLEETK